MTIKKWLKTLPRQERTGVITLLVFCAIVVLTGFAFTVFDILRQAM
ncbi:hypothetical protein [uncultured Alteromonas sp.]|jgi:hypothetical protein|nr:hypothetical protein [uncultured Alteromonas sp.]